MKKTTEARRTKKQTANDANKREFLSQTDIKQNESTVGATIGRPFVRSTKPRSGVKKDTAGFYSPSSHTALDIPGHKPALGTPLDGLGALRRWASNARSLLRLPLLNRLSVGGDPPHSIKSIQQEQARDKMKAPIVIENALP